MSDLWVRRTACGNRCGNPVGPDLLSVNERALLDLPTILGPAHAVEKFSRAIRLEPLLDAGLEV